MTFVKTVRALARRWWIPLLIAAVAVGAVFGLSPKSKHAQTVYTAKAILIPNPVSNQSQSVNLQQAALQVTVGAVPQAAAGALHYTGNPADLAAQVSATVDPTVGTLTLAVTNTDGTRAAAVANEFAKALNANLLQLSTSTYQSQVSSVESRLNDLQNQINAYQGKSDPVSQAKLGSAEDQYRLAYDQFQQLAAQGQPAAPLTFLQQAVPVPSGGTVPPTSTTERSAIAGAVGLVVGGAVAVLLDMLWPRVDDRNDAEKEFGTVVLAEVPLLSRKERRSGSRHRQEGRHMAAFREAYRMLRTSILLIGSAEPEAESPNPELAHEMLVTGPQVILVSSALPREGKSTTVASLAVSMAETGRRVLICDADFRAPQVHRAFGLTPGPGLTDLLSQSAGAQHLADLVHPTGIPGVSLVHSGSQVEDAAELVARRGAQLLDEARAIADVVLLDTAPLLVVSDASELLPAVDAVVMVARAGQTSRDSARRSYELLDRAGIPVLGVVLIGAKSPTSYYYSGRYGSPPEGGGWKAWLERRRGPRGVLPAAAGVRMRPTTWRAPVASSERLSGPVGISNWESGPLGSGLTNHDRGNGDRVPAPDGELDPEPHL